MKANPANCGIDTAKSLYVWRIRDEGDRMSVPCRPRLTTVPADAQGSGTCLRAIGALIHGSGLTRVDVARRDRQWNLGVTYI
jgi:hypothetical protein